MQIQVQCGKSQPAVYPHQTLSTRPDLLQMDSLKFMVWITMRPLHPLPNSLIFTQYSPLLPTIIGMFNSTALSLMGNSMTMKTCLWINHLAMKNLTQRNTASSYTSQSMDLNKPDANGMRSYAACLQTWDLRSARLTQPFSIFTPARIFQFLPFTLMTA